MPINPVQRTQNYQVDPSAESNEEERRREEKHGTKQASKNSIQAPKTAVAKPEMKHSQPDLAPPTDLTSQIIDSEKVIELINHKPPTQLAKQQAFKTRQNEKPKAAITDQKKVNKAF